MTKFDFLLFSNLSESSEDIDINDIYQGSYRIEWYKAPSQGAGHLTMLSRPTNVFFRKAMNGWPKKFTARYDNDFFADYSACGHHRHLSEESQSSILSGMGKQRKSSPNIV